MVKAHIFLGFSYGLLEVDTSSKSIAEVICPKTPEFGPPEFEISMLLHPNITMLDIEATEYFAETDKFNIDHNIYITPQTTPMFLTILLPLISLKSATFFTKFNSLGTLNIFFLIGVVFYLAITWGIHADISDINSDVYIPMFKDSFPSLSGMMALGLFIHNAIITIIKKNRYQENNVLFSIPLVLLVISSILFLISFKSFHVVVYANWRQFSRRCNLLSTQ